MMHDNAAYRMRLAYQIIRANALPDHTTRINRIGFFLLEGSKIYLNISVLVAVNKIL